MKKLLFASALLVTLTCVTNAAVVNTAAGQLAVNAAMQQVRQPSLGVLSASDLRAVRKYEVIGPLTGMSELPEPEVFLMMLVGLCLIGYRASRDSDEKFR